MQHRRHLHRREWHAPGGQQDPAGPFAWGCNASTAIGECSRWGARKLTEPRVTIAGTHRALHADMQDVAPSGDFAPRPAGGAIGVLIPRLASLDTIESINREQLATASDRLLLRGRASRQRPRASWVAPRGSSPAIPLGPLAEGSQPRIVLPARRTQHPAPPVRAPQLLAIGSTARTAPARRGAMPHVSAVAVALAPLVGFAVGLAAVL